MIRKIALTFGGIALAATGAAWLSVQQPALGGFVAPANAAEVEIKEMTIGNPDAKVKVTEYASFTCGHCSTFHEEVYKDLKRDFIDTGKISFTFREVYWDRYALWAGLVSRCGGEMRFFGLVELMMENQRDWAGAKSPAEVADKLRALGRKAGLSNDQLDSCMQDEATAKALIEWSDTNSKAAGIEGTPSLVINGKLYKNMSYKKLKALLEEKLAE